MLGASSRCMLINTRRCPLNFDPDLFYARSWRDVQKEQRTTRLAGRRSLPLRVNPSAFSQPSASLPYFPN